jgi:hypothetical protein
MKCQTDLVALHRCRLCKTRLFAKDTPGHLKRHLLHGDAAEVAALCGVPMQQIGSLVRGGWRKLFERGRKNACPVPGMAILLHNQKQVGRVYSAVY